MMNLVSAFHLETKWVSPISICMFLDLGGKIDGE